MSSVLLPADDRAPENRAERRAVNLVVKENLKRTKVHDPVRITGIFPAPIDLVERVLRGKVVDGRPVGTLSQLYPESQFRDIALDATARWLRDMDKRGYRPHTPPDQIRVSGPYPPHDWGGVGRASAMRAVGYSSDEIFDFGVVDFRLFGMFVAERRYVDEHRLEQQEKREALLTIPHNYMLGGEGRPGRTGNDEILRLLAERDLLVDEAKRRPNAKHKPGER